MSGTSQGPNTDSLASSQVVGTAKTSRKAQVARLLGRRSWAEDGRCDVPANLMLVNFWFQRVLRINGKCSYPVHFTSTVVSPEKLLVGRGVARYLATSGSLYVQAMNGVQIGDGTIIAPGVKIVSANHDTEALGRWVDCGPVIVGERCWLGASCVLLPGVRVGDRSIIGAGAVVTSDVPADHVALGVPARCRPRSGLSA